MAIGTGAALMLGGGALLGGLAGAQKKKTTQEESSTSQFDLAQAGASEQMGGQAAQMSLQQLQGLIGQGPGGQDVTAGLGAQRDLASMLQAYSQGGFMPGAQDFASAQQFAQGAFAGQQESLNQQFADQQTEAKRLAAQLNRPVNDPIIQAKLAQQQMRSQQQLSAEQRGVATQYAQQMPGQRLDFAQQRAGILSGLASQALSNRSNLLSMGSQLQAQGQNFRTQTATKRTTGTQTATGGGGLSGMISGAIGGAGMASGLMNAFGGMGGAGAASGAGGLQMPGFGSSMSGTAQPTFTGGAPVDFFSGVNPYGSSPAPQAPMQFGLNPSRLSQSSYQPAFAGNRSLRPGGGAR